MEMSSILKPEAVRVISAASSKKRLLNEVGEIAQSVYGLDAGKAVAVMAANPSCIKRPVVEYPGGLLVGFKQDEWEDALG